MRPSALRLVLLPAILVACASPSAAPPPTPATPAPSRAGGHGEVRVGTRRLVIAATTDVHGALRGWDYFADRPDSVHGLSRAATVVDSLRAAHPGEVLLVDAGDLLQGTPLTFVASHFVPFTDSDAVHPVVAAMNAMQYDAATIGNHEFNDGVPVLNQAIASARFPFLAANAYRPDGAPAFRGWTIVERNGLRVGIVGATTPGSMLWDGDKLRDHVVLRDIVPELRRAVREARQAGAEVIVASLHSGLDEPSSYDTVTTGLGSENVSARVAHEVPGIDVIVFGHSHRELADTLINGVLLVQPKNGAASVAVATLWLDEQHGRWQVVSKHGELVPVAGRRESSDVLAATEAAHRAARTYAMTPIGRTFARWSADSARVVDTPLMDFVLEVERRAAGADLAAGSAFSLTAGIDSGGITVRELAALYPYENTLRAVRISGRQLRAYLEHSARYFREGGAVDPSIAGFNFDMIAGAEYTLDLTRPAGERLTHLSVRGHPVADTDSFTLALNNYRQAGGGGYAMLRGAPVVYDQQQDIRQLLIDEVRRQGTLEQKDYFRHSWRLVPDSAVAAAYSSLHPTPIARTP